MTEPLTAEGHRRPMLVEYDADNHWLIENDGFGASQIVARDVPMGWGRWLVARLATLDAAREGLDAERLQQAAIRLRAAAVKAGAHIVVTTDYPDGVKAFGILCDAIDAMDRALSTEPEQAVGKTLWMGGWESAASFMEALRECGYDVTALAANPAPAGLDVEWLARSFASIVGWDGAMDWHRSFASKVAAEYASLGSAAEEEG